MLFRSDSDTWCCFHDDTGRRGRPFRALDPKLAALDPKLAALDPIVGDGAETQGAAAVDSIDDGRGSSRDRTTTATTVVDEDGSFQRWSTADDKKATTTTVDSRPCWLS